MECTFYVLMSFLLLSTSTLASGTPIFDSDGEAVLRGTPYRVSAYHPANGGWVGVAELNDTCHVNMRSFQNGQPVMLFPRVVRPGDKTVLVGKVVYVMFFRPPPCEDSPTWKMDGVTQLVTTGGVPSPGSDVDFTRFSVVQYRPNPPVTGRHLYQFLSCPTYDVMCSWVGLTKGKLLGLSTKQLVVQFTRVPQESVGSTAMHPTA